MCGSRSRCYSGPQAAWTRRSLWRERAIPAFIFLGWVVGLAVGLIVGPLALVIFGLPVGGIVAVLLGTPFAFLAPIVAAVLSLFPTLLAALSAVFAGLSLLVLALAAVVALFVAYFLIYLLGYVIATGSIGPLLPAATGIPGLSFPLPRPVGTATAVTIAPTPREFFARGLLAGFNASANALLLLMLATFDPIWAPLVAGYAFIVISLAAVIFVARTRGYQGLLGWSAWFFPVSWIATLPGLILFIFNGIAWLVTRNQPYSVALDFTTGVVESSDGFILNWSGFNGGFSLGNFVFLMRQTTTAAFTVSSVSAHETGHSLNTAAFGGVVLWINAVDENLAPFARQNLAYGELLAEGHSATMPPGTPPRTDFSLALW